MSKRKVFELAAAALLAFGVQQISGAVTAAAQGTRAKARTTSLALLKRSTTNGDPLKNAATSTEPTELSATRTRRSAVTMARRVIAHTITRIVITGLARLPAEDTTARRVTILDPMRIAIIRLALL